MELIDLWKFFRRRWYLVLIPTLIALVATVPELMTPPSVGYQTTLRFSAAQTPLADPPTYEDSSYIPWLASEYLVDNLSIWVTTDSFGREVAAVLAGEGLEVDPGAVAGSIVADNSRSILQVSIGWGNPDELRAIAEAAAEVLAERNQAYFPQSALEAPTVILLDDITIGTSAAGLLARLMPLVKVALAFLAGLGLAALVEYLDDVLRSRDELEALDLPILATIPRHPENRR